MRRMILLSSLPGVILGGVMMYIAWEHNPQGEFHTEAGLEWSRWLGLGALWFLLPFIVGVICAGILRIGRQPR